MFGLVLIQIFGLKITYFDARHIADNPFDAYTEQSDFFIYTGLKVGQQRGDFAIEQLLNVLSVGRVLRANIVVVVYLN